MTSTRPLGAALAALIGLFAASAAAHLMPAGHGALNVVGAKAYVIASVPVAAFRQSSAAEAVKDGVLTAAELKAHQATLRAAVRDGLRVESGGRATAFSSILLNLPSGADHAPDRSTTLTVMIVARLPATPGPLTVRATLWAGDADSLKLEATVTEGRRVTRREVAELSPRAPAHAFFAGPAKAPPPAAPRHHPHGQPHTY